METTGTSIEQLKKHATELGIRDGERGTSSFWAEHHASHVSRLVAATAVSCKWHDDNGILLPL
jgi:hypothetical protein